MCNEPCKIEKIKKSVPIKNIKKNEKARAVPAAPAVIERYEREDELDDTPYAYSALTLFMQRDEITKGMDRAARRKLAIAPYEVFGEACESDENAFHARYAPLFAPLGDDNRVSDVRDFLRDDAEKGKWVVSDFACSRVIDILLTMASPDVATMMVREFGANPGQIDASNAMSAVQYADEGSSKRAHLMQLAREFEHRRGWFALLKKVEIKQ